MCFWSTKTKAHNPNQAFFEIRFTEDSCIIKADFPWTLRNAFLAEYPEFKQNKAGFTKGVKQYLQKHLIIQYQNKALIWQIRQAKAEHSHSIRYIFSAKLPDFQTLEFRNTCMFNLYKNQINFHTIHLKDEKLNFQTSKSKPFFEIDINQNSKSQKQTSSFLFYILIFSGILLGILIIFQLRKRIK